MAFKKAVGINGEAKLAYLELVHCLVVTTGVVVVVVRRFMHGVQHCCCIALEKHS